jgi:hypothetical protein
MPSSCAVHQGTDRTGDISAARSHRSPPMQHRTRVKCSLGVRQSAAASAQAGSSDKTRETFPAARHPRRVTRTVFFLPPSHPLSPPGPRRRQARRVGVRSKIPNWNGYIIGNSKLDGYIIGNSKSSADVFTTLIRVGNGETEWENGTMVRSRA